MRWPTLRITLSVKLGPTSTKQPAPQRGGIEAGGQPLVELDGQPDSQELMTHRAPRPRTGF